MTSFEHESPPGDAAARGEGALPAGGPRPGIFGLETEYAILYDGDDEPPFETIEKVLFEALLSGRKAAQSGGLKGGYFLANGGMLHLEAYIRRQADTRILELATPECRSAMDLTVYSRAFDNILEETSTRSQVALEALGYDGKIVFAKNNMDSRQIGYGCHENYLTYYRPPPSALWLFLLATPLLLLSLIPIVISIVCGLLLVYVPLTIGFLIAPVGRFFRWLYERAIETRPWITENVRGGLILFLTLLLLLPVKLYTWILRRVAFVPLLAELTPFLVTRQVFAGTGYVNFREGVFELSQRPFLTRSLATITLLGRKKTVFDLKGFLFDPWQLFRRTKKLTVSVGDSNLSDVPLFLKVGTTALLVEMLERGESFRDLRLRRPIRALREISRGGPWKQVRLARGEQLSAIELQRAYLRRAQAFFADRADDKSGHDEILRLWEETLDRLADRPQLLADTLDWVAKKSLLDQAVLAVGNWKTFFAWGRVLRAAGSECAASARSASELLRLAPWYRRRRARRLLDSQDLERGEFTAYRDLYFQAQNIDLRFHELGASEGYQRQLEDAGLIDRMTDDETVLRAEDTPPPDTRARVRGYYIAESAKPEHVIASWNEIELLDPPRHVPLPDPFFSRVPTDTDDSDQAG